MEKFDLSAFPTSESAKKMLSYVSDGFYDESYVGKWLFQVMGSEYDLAFKIARELPLQFFPETATWGLMYHEMKWGLPVRQNLSYEERRRLICQKRDCRAPMTPYRMEQYLETAVGFEAHVSDTEDPGEYGFVAPHPNVFKVYFIGEGTLDSKKAHKLLDMLKQSHTAYTVNERTEILLDCTGRGQNTLKGIRFKILVPFWGMRIFDGGWLFDGGILLDAKRRYSLGLGLENCIKIFQKTEGAGVSQTKYTAKVRNTGICRAGTENRFRVDFWRTLRFDGSWNFDGSVLLDAQRKYGVALGMTQKFQVWNQAQGTGPHMTGVQWRQHIAEDIKAKTEHRLAVNFWESPSSGEPSHAVSQCGVKTAIKLCMAADLSGIESVGDLSVETKSKQYWFFDGSVPFDGSRKFNSVYRKETV